jgi:hypothetical protein
LEHCHETLASKQKMCAVNSIVQIIVLIVFIVLVSGIPGGRILGMPTCQVKYCSKRPSFGEVTDSKPRFCVAHKTPSSVDVRNRKCQFAGCFKQATFGNITNKVSSYCAMHRGPFHVVLHGRRCTYVHGCSKYAVFGEISDGVPRFCARHKELRHDNVLKPWCR